MDNNSSDIKSYKSSKSTTYVSKSDQGFENYEQSSSNNNFHLSDSFKNSFSINDKSNGSTQNSLFTDSAYSSLEDKFSFSDKNFCNQSTDKSLTNDFYDSSMKNDFNFNTNDFGGNYSSPNDNGFSMQTDDLSDIFAKKDIYKDSGNCEEFDEVDIANIKKFLGSYGTEMKERTSQHKNTTITDSSKPFTFEMPKVSTVNMLSSESSDMLP